MIFFQYFKYKGYNFFLKVKLIKNNIYIFVYFNNDGVDYIIENKYDFNIKFLIYFVVKIGSRLYSK